MNSSSFSVATYNVLHPYHQNNFSFLPNDGKDWNSRVGTIASNILNSSSSLLCVQELSQDHFKDLKDRISPIYAGYHTKHDGRGGKEKQDGVAVFYREDQFKLKAVRTCDKTQRSTTSRRDLYLDVEELVTHRIIRCAAAHIEGNPNDLNTGNQQLREIISYISSAYPQQDYTIDAVILGCDLNQPQDTERFKILEAANFEANVLPGEESEVDRHRQIDWIFAKLNQNIKRQAGPSVEDVGLPLASDHRMVFSLFHIHPEPVADQPIETPIEVPSPEDNRRVDEKKDDALPPAPANNVIPIIPHIKSQWEKFTEKMSDIFSAKNAFWLVPLSALTLGIAPLMITIFYFFYYNVLHY